jgi:hypothetical protein
MHLCGLYMPCQLRKQKYQGLLPENGHSRLTLWLLRSEAENRDWGKQIHSTTYQLISMKNFDPVLNAC